MSEDSFKLRERIENLQRERKQMSEELSAFRFVLRGERNEKLNLLESNVSLSARANKQKLIINKMWNHLRGSTKLNDAELKALDGEVQTLLGTLAMGPSVGNTSPSPKQIADKRSAHMVSKPGSTLASERRSNTDEAPVFYHAAKHSSPYYYYAEKQEEGNDHQARKSHRTE